MQWGSLLKTFRDLRRMAKALDCTIPELQAKVRGLRENAAGAKVDRDVISDRVRSLENKLTPCGHMVQPPPGSVPEAQPHVCEMDRGMAERYCTTPDCPHKSS